MERTSSDGSHRLVMRGTLPPTLRELYDEYSFRGFDDGAAFAYDDVGQWKRGTQSVMDKLRTEMLPSIAQDVALHNQEVEFAEKLSVNWRLRGYGVVVPASADELSCRNAPQATALRPYFRRRKMEYIAALDAIGRDEINEIMVSAQVRVDRGKGAPFWIPGTDAAGAVALRKLSAGHSDLRSLLRAIQRFSRDRPIVVQTSYIRIQAARGPVKVWVISVGDCLIEAEMNGRAKVRRIAAIPFVFNHHWVPYAEVLRTVMALTPRGQHKGKIEPVLAESANWRYYFALDLKSFDTTVAYETHVAIREELWLPVVERLFALAAPSLRRTLAPPSLMAEIDELIIKMPVLTPPRCRSYEAEIWPAVGQTRSGENPTSWKGTEVRRAHCQAKADHLGLRAGSYFIFNYGDDTLMMTNSAEAGERWNAEPEYLGLKEVPAPDATFLMKRVPYGYGYLGRMVSASINRETSHEPSNVLAAAAAFCTRYHLLRGHPLQRHFLPLLQSYGGPERMVSAVKLAQAVVQEDEQTGDIGATLNLNISASRIAERGHGDQRSDIATSIAQLATVPDVSAADKAAVLTAAAKVDIGQHGQRHSLSWIALHEAAEELPEALMIATLRKYNGSKRKKKKER